MKNILFKFIKSVNFIYLLSVFTIIVLYFKLFQVHLHYPTNDEIITFHRYLNWKGLFWKDAPNNHLLLSFVGNISNEIFGFNFKLLRFYNFLFFCFILFLYCKIFNNSGIFLIFIGIILYSEIIFNYIYIFRGYYISSALFVLIFYIFFKDPEIQKKSLKKILFINFLLFIHSIYTIYLVIPILINLLVIFFKKNKIILFLKYSTVFFIIPSFIIYFIIFLVTGFVSEFSNNFTNFENLNMDYLVKNFFLVIKKSLIPGFKAVFFNVYVQPETMLQGNRIINIINISLTLIEEQLIIFLIFLVSFLIVIFNLLRKKIDNFDYIVIFFFLFFFILNKSPFTRVYVGLIYFFIFHIFLNIEKFFFINKYKEKLFLKVLFSIFLFILLLFSKPNNDYQELRDVILKIGRYNNCTLLNDHLNVKEKWVMMNFYPGRCQYFHDRKNNNKLLY